jgi:hypothetical protein
MITKEQAAAQITAAHFVIVSGELAGETLAVARCDYSEARSAMRRGSFRTAYHAAARVAELAPAN